MKFRYVGDYAKPDMRCEAFGCVFTPGAEIEVPQQYQSKALGNRFFEPVIDEAEVIEDGETAEVSESADAENALPDVSIHVLSDDEKADASDPDNDYNPYEGMSKADLVAMAQERGIDVDGRWSPGKIISKIEAAKEVENGNG